jgi:GH25 family lysozyme M1 (1,4-beta-N-acetylmuramidase)
MAQKISRPRGKRGVILPSNVDIPGADKFIRGTDGYEGLNVDFDKLAALQRAGQLFFAIWRGHNGDELDKKIVEHWQASKGASLRTGMYGVIVPTHPAQVNVDMAVAAIKAVGGFKKGDIGITADVEGNVWKKLPRTNRMQRLIGERENIETWLQAIPNATKRMDLLLGYLHGVEDFTGVRPMFYSSANFPTAVFPDVTPLAPYWNWVANTDVPRPNVQKPWVNQTPPWRIWQASFTAKIDGIENGKAVADLDFFYGSVQQFNDMFGAP